MRKRRDIVIEAIAKGVQLDDAAAGDIRSDRLMTARESDNLLDTINRNRKEIIRAATGSS